MSASAQPIVYDLSTDSLPNLWVCHAPGSRSFVGTMREGSAKHACMQGF